MTDVVDAPATVKPINHWISGAVFASRSGRTGPVFNPATGEQSGAVDFASAEEVDLAVQAAKQALPTWRALSLAKRAELFFAIRELFRQLEVEPAQPAGFSLGARPLRDGSPGGDSQIDVDHLGRFAVEGHDAHGRGSGLVGLAPPLALGLDHAGHGAGVTGQSVDLFPLRLRQPDRPLVELERERVFGPSASS